MAAGYLLKRRTRLRTSFQGSTRRRWSRWHHVARYGSFETAASGAADVARGSGAPWAKTSAPPFCIIVGAEELAIFHRGRRL